MMKSSLPFSFPLSVGYDISVLLPEPASEAWLLGHYTTFSFYCIDRSHVLLLHLKLYA